MNHIDRLKRIQEKRALSVFRYSAENIPFYKKYLEELKVDVRKVRTIQDFTGVVPVLCKEKLFSRNSSNISHICLKGDIKNTQVIFPSSGYSGIPSFGIIGREEFKKQQKFLDYALDYAFDAGKKKVLLINTLSMGITIPALKVTVANTGLRSDVALSLVETIGKEFDKIVIVGENAFIKSLLELGLQNGISWRKYPVNVIFGGESFPETFRTYLERMLGHSDTMEELVVGSSFGFAEIGLNILWETPLTIHIRKKASENKRFRTALFGETSPLCPQLFQHNPLRVYVEERGGNLLFTNLNSRPCLPLIRYATGDKGAIIPFEKWNSVLTGYESNTKLPNMQLEIIAVDTREKGIAFERRSIYPDMVKEALYSDAGLPRLITGHFKMRRRRKKLLLEIQLSKNVPPTRVNKKRFIAAFNKFMPVKFKIRLYDYKKFPYSMEWDLERKYSYVI